MEAALAVRRNAATTARLELRLQAAELDADLGAVLAAAFRID